MEDKYIGISIFSVYGDDFIEPVTKEHGIIKEKKEDYYIAETDDGMELTVLIDETFNNLDFEADIGTDYRVFTDEKDADKYFEYLNNHPYKQRYIF